MNTKTLDDYELGSLLGQGNFGKVYKATRKSDGKTIALKVLNVDAMNEKMIKDIKDEVSALKKLSFPECHPFIVCYYDDYLDKAHNKYLIEMEYIEGQSMKDFVNSKKGNKEQLYYYLLLIARDISEALNYTHDKEILHNDIKLENIMIQDKTFIPKLIDFGLMCNFTPDEYIDDNRFCIKSVGTPLYLAPEYFGPVYYAKIAASDMWALGVALYKGATGNFPLYAKNMKDLQKLIVGGTIPQLKTSNELLNDVVNTLLRRDPDDRLTAGQVIATIDADIDKYKPSVVSESVLSIDDFIKKITYLTFNKVTVLCQSNLKIKNYCTDDKYNNNWKLLIDNTFSYVDNYKDKLKQIWTKLDLDEGVYNYLVYTQLVKYLDPITQAMIYYKQGDKIFDKFTKVQQFLALFLLGEKDIISDYLPDANYFPFIYMMNNRYISDDDINTMLVIMASEGNITGVKYFIEKGGNIHVYNELPLKMSSSNGHLEVVKYLVSKGADVHADNNFALSKASEKGHTDVVNYLKSLN